jgi:hypothetical protein
MKLRIRDNSVRLRLTQSEVTQFAEKGLVESKTDFGNGQVFSYALRSDISIQNLQAEFADGGIKIAIPKNAADHWTKTEEVGINGTDNKIKVLIEKDFACLTMRANEDESDAFPHPKDQEISC